MSLLRRASAVLALVLVVACGAPPAEPPGQARDPPPATVPPDTTVGTVGTVGTVPPVVHEPSAVTPTVTPRVPPDAELTDVMPWPDGAPAPRSPDGRWSVLYLGDSMAFLTVGRLRAELPDWTVIDVTFGGTAPCDWIGHQWLAEALADEPDLVVFSFIGNSITPCTEQAIGHALLDAYERDLLDICAMAAPARCVAVGQPVLDPGVARTLPGPDEPNGMLLAHAYAGDWGFIDAGHAAEIADGTFDPAAREPDGVHFNDAGAAATARRIAEYLRAAVTPPAR